MTGSLDLAGLVRELVQQQTALAQQQAALLHLQHEALRLQRLLVERALGLIPEPAEEVPPWLGSPEPAPPAPGVVQVEPAAPTPAEAVAPDPEVPPATLPVEPPGQPSSEDAPVECGPRLSLVPNAGDVRAAAATPLVPIASSRAARYLQASSPRPPRPVTRLDVERVARLYEAGDAAHLVLQFGEYKGATLSQVAEIDPDYVRRLALGAQRPQVRAAARQLVAVLEACAAAVQRTQPRVASRRTRADGR